MKILITGSESFVGKELIRQCKDKKIEIVGMDIIPKENSDYEYYQLDIKSSKLMENIPNDIDILVHLAALSRDSDCKGKAYECFENNVIGTLNMIKYALSRNVKQFIFSSSEWVYDELVNSELINEDHLINSQSLTSEYALSKLTSEINLHQQYLQNPIDITILRFGIIYGPRKSNWSAIESIASQVKNNNLIEVDSLKNARRFVHVYDIVNGIIKSFNLKGFNIINLTGDNMISIKDIIKTSERIFEKTVDIKERNPSKINIRNPSNKKAKKFINWSPKINLEEGIKTIQQFI
jgi:nucleoside-diphosphate-sugar epimerase